MKIKKIIREFGISIMVKNYDIRIGLIRLGRPRPRHDKPLWQRIKETIYYSYNSNLEIQIINTYIKQSISHYRFLWFAIGWRKIDG